MELGCSEIYFLSSSNLPSYYSIQEMPAKWKNFYCFLSFFFQNSPFLPQDERSVRSRLICYANSKTCGEFGLFDCISCSRLLQQFVKVCNKLNKGKLKNQPRIYPQM